MANPDQPTVSVIMALHQRYEQTMAEYTVIDQAEDDATDEIEKETLRRASKASCLETDALRVAILHQVPIDLTEAAVLQFHITCAYDMAINSEDQPEAEGHALTTAIETIFDFLCCEMKCPNAALGEAFNYGATQAYHKRRNRTGLVEA